MAEVPMDLQEIFLKMRTTHAHKRAANGFRISALCRIFFILCISGVFTKYAIASGILSQPGLTAERLTPITDIVEKAVQTKKIRGAVVVVGNYGKVVYKKSFGIRTSDHDPVPMTDDTIFDLASLTKAVATGTAIMMLSDSGKLNIDDPVIKYWPAFQGGGKSKITIRQLLTHYSGFSPGLDLNPNKKGNDAVLKRIIAEKPVAAPGSMFIYSDTNFQVLGELVYRISGKTLDIYCADHIFKPLGMTNTTFNPPLDWRPRIAPTRFGSKWSYGVPHDPECRIMGGVAGHAGLFSTAGDLSKFAEMMLRRGDFGGTKLLKPQTVEQMTSSQSPPGKKHLHGLGWDMVEAFYDCPEKELPPGSYGHLGYTGAALWIDPADMTYIILLANRNYPNGRKNVKILRAEIRAVVSEALCSMTGCNGSGTVALKEKTAKESSPRFKTGIEVMSDDGFPQLTGLNVGLITNHTGVDTTGRRTVDLLYNSKNLTLKAIFSPEHGLSGKVDAPVSSSTDAKTGLPVHSLYGDVKRPTEKMLAGIDALVFDIQDAGVRFYTYMATIGYAMEEAAKRNIPFYVLDRPNPITASAVQGPVPDNKSRSFTSYFPVPLRHGMTIGELARMFNTEYKIGANLTVIRMKGYNRASWYDETGLPWINPSPNLRNLTQASLYPAVGVLESANISVGRGTSTPFEHFGAPWIDGQKLAAFLNDRKIPGVSFKADDFTPSGEIYKNKPCHGTTITITDRSQLNAARLGVELINGLYTLYPQSFRIDDTAGMIGTRAAVTAVKLGADPVKIVASWQQPLGEFLKLRQKYLLY
jgi:uncharacterized protein YbbC (DUF1343 family)